MHQTPVKEPANDSFLPSAVTADDFPPTDAFQLSQLHYNDWEEEDWLKQLFKQFSAVPSLQSEIREGSQHPQLREPS